MPALGQLPASSTPIATHAVPPLSTGRGTNREPRRNTFKGGRSPVARRSTSWARRKLMQRSNSASETMYCRVAAAARTIVDRTATQVERVAYGAVVEGTGSGDCRSCCPTFRTTCNCSPRNRGRATEHDLARIAVGPWASNHWYRSFRFHRRRRTDVLPGRTDCAVAAPICGRKRLGLLHPYPGLRSSVARAGHRAHRRSGRRDRCHAFQNSERCTCAPVRCCRNFSRVCLRRKHCRGRDGAAERLYHRLWSDPIRVSPWGAGLY